MLKTDLYDIKGEKTGQISLPEAIFGAKINSPLEVMAVRVYLANQRSARAKTKTRSEINRTKAKWFRQKGTGRARHGARSANIFVGGGVVFGPTGQENYQLKMNQKMRQLALFSALTGKLKDKRLLIIDDMAKIKPKTKSMAQLLSKLAIKGSVLVVLPQMTDRVDLAARNIAGLEITLAGLLNTYTVLQHRTLILMKESVDKLKEVYLK